MPSEKTAILFPGQGSQVSGMRETVRDGDPELFERCCELVGEDPFERIEESTRFAQPAIFCASLVGWDRLSRSAPAAFAGHSLGELTALTAAGALDRQTGLALVVERSRLMASATGGGMLALLGADLEAAEGLAADHDLVVANDNAPGQLVLSGPLDGINGVRKAARERGLRSMRLGVSAAFHSPAMEPAARAFATVLAEITFAEPLAPVWSGLTAAPFTDPRAQLADVVAAPVRWRELVLGLIDDGHGRFVDVGPGSTLAKMVARTTDQEIELLDLEGALSEPVA